MPGARQRLAQILSTRFKDRNFSDTYIASRCKVTIKTVESWREGLLVPNTGEWTDILQYIERDFYMHNSLWREAKAEEDNERRDTIRALDRAQRIGEPEISSKVGTNVGVKIMEAVSQTSREPHSAQHTTDAMRQLGQTPRGFASDGRLLSPTRPDGSMTIESQRERRRFVKGILLQRPYIRIDGKDGLLAQLRTRFGVGINPKVVQEIRDEIAKEQQNEHPAQHKVSEITVPEIKPPIFPEHKPKDLQAGVELILAAVPDLQQLIITVDDKGEASIDFKIRKTVDGSLKISKSAK